MARAGPRGGGSTGHDEPGGVRDRRSGHEWLESWRPGHGQRKLVEFADTYRQVGEEPLNPFLPEMAAAVAAGRGMHATAARLLGAGEAWRLPGGLTESGMPMPGWDEPRHTAVVSMVIDALGEAEYRRLSAEGAAMAHDDVIRIATQLG